MLTKVPASVDATTLVLTDEQRADYRRVVEATRYLIDNGFAGCANGPAEVFVREHGYGALVALQTEAKAEVVEETA